MARHGDRAREAGDDTAFQESPPPEVEYTLEGRDPTQADKWWAAPERVEGPCSRVLGSTLVTEETIEGLLREGRLSDRREVRVPAGEEIEPHPEASEAIVFVAYFEAGLRIPAAGLVGDVLQTFGLELAQMTPSAIARLAVYSWALRMEACWPTAALFAWLHDARYEPAKREDGTLPIFGSVDFVLRPQCRKIFPADSAWAERGPSWMRWWFYHRVADGSGLACSGRPVVFNTAPGVPIDTEGRRMARRLVGITARFNMRDLAEEFVMYGAAPLSAEWRAVPGGLRWDIVRPSVCSVPRPSGPCK